LRAQEVSNALYGLQGMSSDRQEVLDLVRVLTGKVESCRESLDAQHIGNAMYGLQHMDGRMEEVRSLMSALLDVLPDDLSVLKAQDIGMFLFGVRSISFEGCRWQEITQSLIHMLRDVDLEKNDLMSIQSAYQFVSSAYVSISSIDNDESALMRSVEVFGLPHDLANARISLAHKLSRHHRTLPLAHQTGG